MVIPITLGIYTFLMQSLLELNTEVGKKFCAGLIESVKKRLFPYETRTVTKISTILDPRFKKEAFRNQENANSAAVLLEQEMYSLVNNRHRQEQICQIQKENSSSDRSKETSKLFGFLENRINEKSKSLTADIIITKRQYLERPNAKETDP